MRVADVAAKPFELEDGSMFSGSTTESLAVAAADAADADAGLVAAAGWDNGSTDFSRMEAVEKDADGVTFGRNNLLVVVSAGFDESSLMLNSHKIMALMSLLLSSDGLEPLRVEAAEAAVDGVFGLLDAVGESLLDFGLSRLKGVGILWMLAAIEETPAAPKDFLNWISEKTTSNFFKDSSSEGPSLIRSISLVFLLRFLITWMWLETCFLVLNLPVV
ncbi:hypothetical protein WICPIJ_003582 [Wickerhamomyces pijperi]|uniref:Uncharacterized protein n=1 Tax=Wickerhamomyces pijperi TaxID=599730 RepID=A0A9P8Q9E7_WICPI|nr:hypothetical protein WICPIJ_003582 [Wickerhamomyces pijperi]